jgi:hypothetical protein
MTQETSDILTKKIRLENIFNFCSAFSLFPLHGI